MDHKGSFSVTKNTEGWKHYEGYLKEILKLNEEALVYNYRALNNTVDVSEKIRGRIEVIKEILSLDEAIKQYEGLVDKEQQGSK